MLMQLSNGDLVGECCCSYSQKVQLGQQVQGCQIHHGLQQGPLLHEHPEVRHHPVWREKQNPVFSPTVVSEPKYTGVITVLKGCWQVLQLIHVSLHSVGLFHVHKTTCT